jgi:selenocysteine-specific elongation factor
MPAPQINITLGTAGHIDHGKTALVKLLTGCDTDTLKEEKERGMSIDLGFAPCVIADLEVGIVDVPGHERFVKTMVAGATGIDGVILVVAADDGVMPQTREHLDILTLLGIEHGMVALTKIDRVAADHLELVRADLEDFLKGTFLDGAPIAPISSITAEGFDAFYDALVALAKSITPKGTGGIFRVPVDRTFSVKGYGTVVTGIPVAGSVAIGDELVLLPQGTQGRVSGIQVYNRMADAALAGQCAALNVRQWEHDTIVRGNTVAVPGYFASQHWYACTLRLLPHEKLLVKNAAHVKFHTGTSETGATLYLMEGDQLRAGETCLAQVRLDEPLVAGPGDRFIVRALSPVLTVGGGTIVEALTGKLKRTRAGVLEDLQERAEAVGDDERFVAYCAKTAPDYAASAQELSLRAKVPAKHTQEILDELVKKGVVYAVPPKHYTHAQTARALDGRVLDALKAFHESSPQSPGLRREQLQEQTGLPKDVLDGAAARLKDAGAVIERGDRLALASHKEALSDEDQARLDRIESLFRESAFKPPSLDEAAAQTGMPADEVRRLVRLLAEQGRLVVVAEEMLFHRDAVEQARERLVAHLQKEGKFESVKFKYMLDTTRKYALPLLDYFDRIGLTLRVHNTRYLKTQKEPKAGR